MPAENHISITGRLTADPKLSDGNRPSSFRVASYCSGGGDNKRTAFVTIKSFDHDTVATLGRGMEVKVEGRLDPWQPQDSQSQVLDVMADDGGISMVDRDRDRPAQTRRVSPPQQEEAF